MASARTLYLPDGTRETIYSPEDMARVMERYIGYDAAELFRENTAAAMQYKDDQINALETELDNYTMTISDRDNCIEDMQEIISELDSELAAKRINRKKLDDIAEKFYETLRYYGHI